MQIEVSQLTKDYKITNKEHGLKGSIKGLFKKNYKTVNAVNNINFSIKQGECVGFIGPNGAGKTTTIKMLTGLIYPTSGNVNVLGHVPSKRENNYKRQIALVMGNKTQLWWDLSALESFELQRKIYDIPLDVFNKNLSELSEILNVSHLMNIPVRNLSLGERMKMELIVSLLHNPKVLFLDEPTIGLDIASQKNIRKFLCEINKKYKTTIIMTSHYMEDIESVCDRLILISKGEIIFDGNKDLLADKFNDKINIYVSFKENVNLEKIKPLVLSINENKGEYEIGVSKENHITVMKMLMDSEKIEGLRIGETSLEYIVDSYYEMEGKK